MKAIMEVEIVALELKYCERCGNLWLREQGTEEVYCETCVAKMSESAAHRLRIKRQSEVEHYSDMEGFYNRRALICGEGGNA
ncbi:MAG: hypothetical protein LAO03_21040 [Acidobacteriia bacterium]|nr:hypothetical protein [Terriglobia bacterium]